MDASNGHRQVTAAAIRVKRGSGVFFGHRFLPIVNRCPKKTPDPLSGQRDSAVMILGLIRVCVNHPTITTREKVSERAPLLQTRSKKAPRCQSNRGAY